MIEPFYRGDMRDVLFDLHCEGAQFHACVTDPPYHLASTVKRFGKPGSAPAQFGTDGAYARASRGFMGKEWDGGDVSFRPETWRAVYDVLLPGGYLLAFGGTRTYHRIAVAIEDAGFELRDTIMWMFGTGFPKSHDVSKAIDKATKVPATAEAAQWSGWGTALKPAYEPIIVARKPSDGTVARNVLTHGCGGLNIDASRVGESGSCNKGCKGGNNGIYSPIGQIAAIDYGKGRWPANVIHDGSDGVLDAFAAFGDRPGQQGRARTDGAAQGNAVYGAIKNGTTNPEPRNDTGSAARFFYSTKATAADRAGSAHPTVKPLALMRYLLTMVTPPGGRVLDPFCGSGTTLQAALECGFSPTGIERDADYAADVLRRLEAHALA